MGSLETSRGSVPRERSLNEWVVLALLVERPAHGFALAKELRPGTDLGRVLTVQRPLVYRALDRLVLAGLAEPHHTEPGDAGPNRTLHRATPAGDQAVAGWLVEPVEHVRDLRLTFLLKMRLTERQGADAGPLVAAQRAALDETLERLSRAPARDDVVDRWRRHSAVATRRFFDDLVAVR